VVPLHTTTKAPATLIDRPGTFFQIENPALEIPSLPGLAETGLLIVCEKCWEIMRNFQEVTLCGRKGLLYGKLCDFSEEDFK